MYQKIERFAANVSALLLFILMMLTLVDVAGRNLIRQPVPGASELTEILLALVIFLMLPRVALRRQHITIDLIGSVIGPKTTWALDFLAALLSATMFFLMAWQSWVSATKAMGYGDSTATLSIPVGPILYVIAVLAALIGVASLAAIFPGFRNAAAESDSGNEPVVV